MPLKRLRVTASSPVAPRGGSRASFHQAARGRRGRAAITRYTILACAATFPPSFITPLSIARSKFVRHRGGASISASNRAHEVSVPAAFTCALVTLRLCQSVKAQLSGCPGFLYRCDPILFSFLTLFRIVNLAQRRRAHLVILTIAFSRRGGGRRN